MGTRIKKDDEVVVISGRDTAVSGSDHSTAASDREAAPMVPAIARAATACNRRNSAPLSASMSRSVLVVCQLSSGSTVAKVMVECQVSLAHYLYEAFPLGIDAPAAGALQKGG